MLKIKQIDHAVLVTKHLGAFAFLHLANLEFLRIPSAFYQPKSIIPKKIY